MTGFYPRGVALQEKLQRLAIEAGESPLTVGDGLRRIAAGADSYGIPLLAALAALVLAALYSEAVYLLVIWLAE